MMIVVAGGRHSIAMIGWIMQCDWSLVTLETA